MPARAGLIWLGIGLLSSASVYLAHGLGIWNHLMADHSISFRVLPPGVRLSE